MASPTKSDRITAFRHAGNLAPLFIALALSLFPVGVRAAASAEPEDVVRAYLRSVYARDFMTAYGFISSADRAVRSREDYARQRGVFSGFVLEAAKVVSESIQTEIVERAKTDDRLRLRVRYRIPNSQALGPLLLDWNPYRLNGLGAGDRARLLDTLRQLQRTDSLEMITGENTFNMVREAGAWRIFLNWADGVRIPLRLEIPPGAALQAQLSKPEVNLQPGDTFEVRLKVRNTSPKPIVARIGHLVEPQPAADYLEFVQCGFLLPVTVPAGAEEEFSGTYLLRGSLPEGMRELRLTYDFRILE